jgi:acyl carrier protein
MRLPSTSPHLPSEHALREELRLFLCEEVLAADTLVHDDQPLVEVGVDSFALMEILLFVERRHGCVMPLEQLSADHVRTVRTLSAWVRTWLGGAAA